MAQKDRSLLPRVELWLILGSLIFIVFWAATQCSQTRRSYRDREAAQRRRDHEDSLAAGLITRRDTAARPAPAASGSSPASAPSRMRLYVSIKKLKMRDQPGLNGKLLGELPLHEEVYFLNEVTRYKQAINLGKQIVEEPWVKIQTQRGQVGWVFGAGVHYYKTTHPGAD